MELVKSYGKNIREDFEKYYKQYLHRLFKEAKEADVILIIDYDEFSLNNFKNAASLQLALSQISTLEMISKGVKEVFVVNCKTCQHRSCSYMIIAFPGSDVLRYNAHILTLIFSKFHG